MRLTTTALVWIVSFYAATAFNLTFYLKSYEALLIMNEPIWKLGFCYVFVVSLFLVFFSLLASRMLIKFWLILVIISSSVIAYFTDSFLIVVDEAAVAKLFSLTRLDMIETFTFKQALYVLILGLIPSYFIARVKLISRGSFYREVFSKAMTAIIGLLLIWCTLLFSPKIYNYIEANQPEIRQYIVPEYAIHSTIQYIQNHLDVNQIEGLTKEALKKTIE